MNQQLHSYRLNDLLTRAIQQKPLTNEIGECMEELHKLCPNVYYSVIDEGKVTIYQTISQSNEKHRANTIVSKVIPNYAKEVIENLIAQHKQALGK